MKVIVIGSGYKCETASTPTTLEVPSFGTRDNNGNYTFQCQHGPRECEGNKVHACALKYLPEESQAAFINCSMSSSTPPEAGPSCASQLGLNFTRVEQCINEDGPGLLAANG
ncbi:unnamed protein product, partial [Allacma fusca]